MWCRINVDETDEGKDDDAAIVAIALPATDRCPGPFSARLLHNDDVHE